MKKLIRWRIIVKEVNYFIVEIIILMIIIGNLLFSTIVLTSIGIIGLVLTLLLIFIHQEVRKLNKGV